MSEPPHPLRLSGPESLNPPISLTDHLAQSVIRLMQQDGLRQGDRLPAIKAMAERFAVAIPTLREAIRRLEVMGLVEVLHGSGVYVRNDNARMVFGNPAVARINSNTVLELLDARLVIEPVLAARAAERISDEEARELGEILTAVETKISDDMGLHILNMRFHCRIAEISGHGVLYQTLKSYTEIYSSEQLQVLRLYVREKRANDYLEHVGIGRAVIERKSVEAFSLMKQHLENVVAKTTSWVEGRSETY